MRQVPRGAFIPSALQGLAYEDCALPIEAGQTISQPYIVAHMIAAAEIGPQSRVLEVGAGSGYAAAVISRIAARVYAIERHDVLTRLAQERLTRLGYGNVALRTGDGTRGWSEAAPFDAILVSAGGPCVPAALKDQLAVGGRLVMPIGAAAADQRLTVLVRSAEGGFRHADLGGVRFVPLVSDQG
jgi:protein-L-isoaspartate(D-aspartate) O-methyltransferase